MIRVADASAEVLVGTVAAVAVVLVVYAYVRANRLRVSVPRVRAPRLTRPVQRMALLVMGVGCALMIAGLYTMWDGWSLWSEIWDSLTFRHYSSAVFRWGFWLTLLGLMFSYLFDPIPGRLWRWIKNG